MAIDAAPIKGVLRLPIAALKVASIALRRPASRNRAITLTAEQFRYGFENALPEQESADLYDRWTVPSPGRLLFRGRPGELHPELASEGEYRKQDARTVAHGMTARTSAM